jgi:chromosome segregation ATPase
MSDATDLADRANQNVKALEQLCALRASLATMLAQTLQTEATIKNRIAELECEAQRLRAQLDRTTPAIETLKQKIHAVDDAIRQQGRVVHAAVAVQSSHTEVEREKRVEDAKQTGRPVRRKDG